MKETTKDQTVLATLRKQLALSTQAVDKLERHCNQAQSRVGRAMKDAIAAAAANRLKLERIQSVYESLYVAICGVQWKLVADFTRTNPDGSEVMTMDDFVDRLYKALVTRDFVTQTKRLVELIKSSHAEQEGLKRKIEKLHARIDGQSPESVSATVLVNKLTAVNQAVKQRRDTAVRKFLECRKTQLRTILCATEIIYKLLGGDVPKGMIIDCDISQMLKDLARLDGDATGTRRVQS